MNQASSTSVHATRSNASANRMRIWHAARALAAENGFGLQSSEVATRAGIGAGTLYRNFRSKDEMINALIEDLDERVQLHLKEMLNADDVEVGFAIGIERLYTLSREYGRLFVAVVTGTEPTRFKGRFHLVELQHGFETLFERGKMREQFPPNIDSQFTAAVMLSLLSTGATLASSPSRDHGRLARATMRFCRDAMEGTHQPGVTDHDHLRPHPIVA